MRALAALAASALALLAGTALAAGDTSEDFARDEAAVLQGPLALSADGQWRLHVDAHDVLHRVNLADPSRAQTLALPVPVRLIAASRSGQKVALLIDHGCVGRADFGSTPGAVARIDWRPDTPPGVAASAWGPRLPEACRQRAGQVTGRDVVAISGDGRQVATATEVVDVDTPRVIATLPGGRDEALLLRFVDGDRRLLVASAFLGQTTGSEHDPSRLEIATWDLATQTLHALWVRELQDGADVPSLLPAYAARSGQLLAAAPGPWRSDGQPRLPSALEAWHLAECRATPDARPPIGDWTSVAVDPSGRWIAGTRAILPGPGTDDAELQGGFRTELIVQDVATGRRLARQAWKHELRGLISNGDGSALFALVAPAGFRWAAETHDAPDPAVHAGEVVEFRLPPQALRAPAATTAAWPREPCPADREQRDARVVAHARTAFAPRWTLAVHRFSAQLAPSPVSPQLPAGSMYPCRGSCSDIFARTDSSLWVDDGATIAQIHPADGRRLRTLPTPRSDKVSSVVLAASGGFFNAQGDTLSWRPFDAPGAAMRQVVDRRPGQEIILLQRQGNTVLAAWVRKRPANASAEETSVEREATYAVYSPQARLIRETKGTEDAQGDSWPTSDDLQHTLAMRNVAPCHDETGALAEGYDWRIGPFESVMAWACGPAAGAARIALWSVPDATPRAAVDAPRKVRIVSSGGTIGVASEEDRPFHLRVFDAALRRELGSIDLPSDNEIVDITVDADLGLVFVETTAGAGLVDERRILAYDVR